MLFMMYTPTHICVFSENDIHSFQQILKAKLKETSVHEGACRKSPEGALTGAFILSGHQAKGESFWQNCLQ